MTDEAHFIGDLDVRLVDDTTNEGRGTWELLADFGFHSHAFLRDFITRRGMLTDFASVPRAPLIWLVAGDRGHKAAVIHDGLYRESPHTTTRDVADEVLREALICEGFSEEEADAWYFGVRVGGMAHWNDNIPTIGVGTSSAPQLP